MKTCFFWQFVWIFETLKLLWFNYIQNRWFHCRMIYSSACLTQIKRNKIIKINWNQNWKEKKQECYSWKNHLQEKHLNNACFCFFSQETELKPNILSSFYDSEMSEWDNEMVVLTIFIIISHITRCGHRVTLQLNTWPTFPICFDCMPLSESLWTIFQLVTLSTHFFLCLFWLTL